MGLILIGAKHILVGASQNQVDSSHTSKSSKSTVSVLTGLPSGKQLNDVAGAQQTTLNRSTINGATGITLNAQGLVNVDASQLAAAQGDIHITGANVNLQSDLNSRSASDHATQSNTGVSWQDLTGTFRPGQGQNYKAGVTANNADTTLVDTVLTAQNIDIQSTVGDITLGAIQATAHGSRNANGSQDPGSIELNAAHDLNFTTVQTARQQSTDISQSDIAWQVKKGSGTVDQTTHYTQLNTPTLDMAAAHRITAATSVKDSAAVLATEPGMSWINPLLHDPKLSSKVDWNRIQEIHQHWDYRAQGLTPAAAAVITIVVAYFTAGSGSAAVAGVEGSATVTAGEVAAAAAITAGVAAISSQAAINLINNGGDVGATLKQLGSSQSIRNIATAMITAGAVSEVAQLSNLSAVTAQSSFAANAELGIVRGVTTAVVNSAINGTSLESNLRTDIAAGLLSAVSAKGANWIGDEAQTNNLNGFTHILAHAVAGCAVGAASGGSAGRGCGAGALGASVGEMAAQFYGSADPQSTVAFARMISGIAAAAAGEDATGIAIASTAGANAARNNYLLHITQLTALESACHANSPGACGLVSTLDHSQSQPTSERKGVWQIVKNVDLNGNIVAYSAYNTGTNQVDFVMNPSDLPGFLATGTGTLLQENSVYYHAPGYVISGGLAADSFQNGHIGLGLSLAGQSWGQALTDPGWLVSMVGGLAGGGLAAEEAGAVKAGVGAIEQSVATNSNPFATQPNAAFFWSGRSESIGGQDVAAQIAQQNGGITLETLIAQKGIQMPAWEDATNSAVVQAWQNVSAQYAAGASGTVRAVIGSNLRLGNVWETVELPALINNPNVTQIITIDPATGASKVIFTRDK